MKLFPAIVTLHLMGGLVLLMLLALQLEKPSATTPALASNPFVPLGHFHDDRRGKLNLTIWLAVTMICVWLQIALGGWVSTNYAVLACSEFPTCLNGAWVPATTNDWSAGFTLWRELGTVNTAALTAIHLTHRMMALVVLVAITGLIMQLKKYPMLRKLKIWLMLLLTLQILTGISNVVFSWPLLAAVMHTGGAAALVLVLTRIGAQASATKPPL
jgi:cytochrome c oxidase assembly protein subunit 15